MWITIFPVQSDGMFGIACKIRCRAMGLCGNQEHLSVMRCADCQGKAEGGGARGSHGKPQWRLPIGQVTKQGRGTEGAGREAAVCDLVAIGARRDPDVFPDQGDADAYLAVIRGGGSSFC